MRALITEGDEVLVQARTWVATVHAIKEAGGNPIICDMEKTGRYLDLNYSRAKTYQTYSGTCGYSHEWQDSGFEKGQRVL